MSRFIDGVEGGIVGFISGGEEGPEEFVVMSALTHPMAVNVNLKGKDGEHPSLHWGVQGLAHSIPKGFEIEVIVQHGRTSFTDTVLGRTACCTIWNNFSSFKLRKNLFSHLISIEKSKLSLILI